MKKTALGFVTLAALALPSLAMAQTPAPPPPSNTALVKACFARANQLAGQTAVRGEVAEYMADRCIRNGGNF